MRTQIQRTLLTLSLIGSIACSGGAQNSVEADGDDRSELSPTPAQLEGDWESACVDPGDGQAILLDFAFTEESWALDYTVHADPACGTPFMTATMGGPYELGPASTAIEGARQGDFTFARRSLTPHMDAAVDFLSQSCGGSYAVGEATPLPDGCAALGMYSLETCPIDHDIVLFAGKTLTLGQRPTDNNMCEPGLRPKAPGLPLTRQ